MFSCTSTNTSMSAKRRTTLLASGIFRIPEMASASGRLLLPATSLISSGAALLRLASRVSKGIDGTPLTLGAFYQAARRLVNGLQRPRAPRTRSAASAEGRGADPTSKLALVNGLLLRQQ